MIGGGTSRDWRQHALILDRLLRTLSTRFGIMVRFKLAQRARLHWPLGF